MSNALLHAGQCLPSLSYGQGLAASLFLGGLVAGFSHCTMMCGPFVISQSQKLEKASSAILLPYHLGRITTYVSLAVFLHSFISLTFIYAPIKNLIAAPMLMTAALFFLVTAFPKLAQSGLLSWANIRYPQSLSRILNQGMRRSAKLPSFIKTYAMGVLLGIMPCGMVVAALLAASTAPSLSGAAAAMSAFGAGTVPALVLTALTGRFFMKRFDGRYAWVRKAPLLISTLWLCFLAGSLLITG
ncbi:MAG: sulfite exporter TauE/SafE family protein [Pseudobdellovibrionaceae bacterium]